MPESKAMWFMQCSNRRDVNLNFSFIFYFFLLTIVARWNQERNHQKTNTITDEQIVSVTCTYKFQEFTIAILLWGIACCQKNQTYTHTFVEWFAVECKWNRQRVNLIEKVECFSTWKSHFFLPLTRATVEQRKK